MIELFPAKCRNEILRCGGSVWAGIVMKHHNIVSEISKHWLAVSFCVLAKATSAPSVNTISENEVYRHNFMNKWPWNLNKMQGNWRNGESSVLWIFSSTVRTKSSLTTDGRPLRGSLCTFWRPLLKCLIHLRTIESLMACSPYTSQSWRRMSAGFMFLIFKKRITERISHAAGFSIFLNIVNTQGNA
jgi:hypothetical protein